MSAYSETSRQRLYRDADRAMLGGVCAGLAGHFGLNLKVTRFLAFIAFLMAMPMAVLAYLAAVCLIPAESRRDEIIVERSCCWGIRRTRRSAKSRKRRKRHVRNETAAAASSPTIKDVRKRYQSLDKRLADLEKQVTSPRFQLEQEFRKL